MKPFLMLCLLLLALGLALGVLGMVLVARRTLRARGAGHFARAATLGLLAAYYYLANAPWPGVSLRALDFWSLMVIIAILGYALVWAALAFQMNRAHKREFEESYMLSMLYTESQQLPQPEFEPTQWVERKPPH